MNKSAYLRWSGVRDAQGGLYTRVGHQRRQGGAMNEQQQRAYTKAMELASKLSKLKTRRAMAPHVHAWAEQIKAMLTGN